jgi:carboxylesterase
MLKKGSGSQVLMQDNKDKVVFMVHGFRGTPDNFTELSQVLFNKGYSVFNMRLPGHGLINEDEIFKIKLRDWENYVENIYLDIADQYKKVYFCGFSLGAALQIKLLTKYQNVEKCVFISPMIQLKKTVIILVHILKLFKKKIYKSGIDCSIEGELFKGCMPFIPIPQVYETYKLTKKLINKLNRIKSKTLCILSKNDHVLNYEKIKNIVSTKSSFNLITLEKSFHNSLADVEKEQIAKKVIEWLNEKTDKTYKHEIEC